MVNPRDIAGERKKKKKKNQHLQYTVWVNQFGVLIPINIYSTQCGSVSSVCLYPSTLTVHSVDGKRWQRLPSPLPSFPPPPPLPATIPLPSPQPPPPLPSPQPSRLPSQQPSSSLQPPPPVRNHLASPVRNHLGCLVARPPLKKLERGSGIAQ